ncbi:hypothetical protein [Knoellia sinensis]|uniref:hypothetical protein n=1 Tax=Knoellia sinensis TaxID=136100 RepID=UPI0012EB66B5|nr:hypothetical protein [Knoellia sinensis]
MRGRTLRLAGIAMTLTLALSACTGDNADDSGTSGDASPKRTQPSDITGPIKAAAQSAGSVVVNRTEVSGSDDGGEPTHEEIETSFAEPVSARVLHVGDEIWTLDVVDGVGYLKDQSERKSNNRWEKLDAAATADRLEHGTLAGLLGVLDGATALPETATASVRGVDATCHTFPLSGGADATARVCVDNQQRPVELVETNGDQTNTSVFTNWGVAIDAIAPPAHLVD